MIDVRSLVQQALDTTMYPLGVMSYWQRKADSAGKEYVVYTLDSDDPVLHADNAPLYNSAEIIVRYYYPNSKLSSTAGRGSIPVNERAIQNAMTAAGFTIISGPQDAGDIDDVGLFTSVMIFAHGRVSDG